jgi:pimeloyl-ACP methyl ester carboxylesterase
MSVCRPVYFKSGQETLFGWLHTPEEHARTDLGLVLCKPFGYESVCSHVSLRAFADACAAAGAAVLRFDYSGTGDSSGVEHEQDQIEQWCGDISAAAAALRSQCGLARVGLLGVRMGALLAGLVAAQDPSLSPLIAVAPLVSGRTYLRELRAFHATSSAEALGGTEGAAATGLEVTGFRLSQASVDHLSKVDLLRLCDRAVADALILDREDLPSASAWAEALKGRGNEVSYFELPGIAEMLATPHASEIPTEMVAAVGRYVLEYCSGLERHATAGPARNDWMGSLEMASEDGHALVERPQYVDQEQKLFAIATARKPHGSQEPRRGVILLNCGASSHIGPNRMYVDLARRWAARGYWVMRLDLLGLGDSAARNGAFNEVYPAGALQEITLAAKHFRREYGIEHLTLAGLCAGAYHALRAAIAGLPVNNVLLINPLTYFWKPGSKLSDLQDAEVFKNTGVYVERVASFKSWRKLLAGRVNIWRIGMVYLRRVLMSFISNAKNVSRALHIRWPRDLGWELKSLTGKGVQVVFLFAREDAGYGLLRLEAGSALKVSGERCRVHVIDDADHIFTQRPARQRLKQLLTHELTAESIA